MKYDDRPLWEQNKNQEEEKINKSQSQFWKGGTYSTAKLPSDLMIWWEQHAQLRRQGLFNEIDEADIRAAQKGVLNKWHSRVKANPEIFDDIKGNWSKIKELQ